MIPIADQIKFIQGEAAFTLCLTINSTKKEADELTDKLRHLDAVLGTLQEVERNSKYERVDKWPDSPEAP